MKPAKKYASAGAIRRALEDRLRQTATAEHVDLARLRRQVAFDRLLARLFHSDEAPWALKGGYAMELQLRVARTTVDIDLTLPASLNLSSEEAPATAAVREMLQEAASLDLGDWFVYTVGAPMMDLDAAPYGGARYPIDCRMDGRTFAKFHLDVGIGDVLITPLQKIQGQDWLGFAEIPAAEMRLISKEQQVAEKLHAYSLPRSTPNSRVKDLVDLLLLVRTGEVRQPQLTEAVRMTFDRRKTHAIPLSLVPPPESWDGQFHALATQCGMTSGMDDSFHEVETFLAQVLRSGQAK
jgi:Nucleotidyl transferase AbiEii toxin, Type IV TA system